MLSSDVFYYFALIIWVLGVLYMGGFFPWLVAMYHHMSYSFTPAPPKSAKPVNYIRLAELVDLWSASKKLPGEWDTNTKENEKSSLETMDVGDGYVLVQSEIKDLD